MTGPASTNPIFGPSRLKMGVHAISPDRLVSVGGVDIRRYYSLFPSRHSARRSTVALLRSHLEASLPFATA
jgi:hypothetical protein